MLFELVHVGLRLRLSRHVLSVGSGGIRQWRRIRRVQRFAGLLLTFAAFVILSNVEMGVHQGFAGFAGCLLGG